MPDLQIADIWSSGVILYAMLYGKYPFDAKEARFARKIVNAEYKLLSVRPELSHWIICTSMKLRKHQKAHCCLLIHSLPACK